MTLFPAGKIDDVRAAQALLERITRPTPLEYSCDLSELVGSPVRLKCENLQRAGSFKISGAYTRMARLTDDEKRAGSAEVGPRALPDRSRPRMPGVGVPPRNVRNCPTMRR